MKVGLWPRLQVMPKQSIALISLHEIVPKIIRQAADFLPKG
jgi:hypothetical protein